MDCRPRFLPSVVCSFAAIYTKFRLSKLFLLNYELNIGLASLFSVIFYTFALLIGGTVQRRIASRSREGIFALSVSYSKVWKTLNIESDGYWECAIRGVLYL